MKKHRKPGFYFALMLAQPLVFALFFVLGALLDSALWKSAESAQGHPAPVFSLLLPILGAAVCLVVFLIALVGLIRSLRRRKREREERAAPAAALFCPYCGAPAEGNFCGGCGKRLK